MRSSSRQVAQQQRHMHAVDTSEWSNFDYSNVWRTDTTPMSADRSGSDTTSTGNLSEIIPPPPPRPPPPLPLPPPKYSSPSSEDMPWYQRKCTLFTLLIVLVVALAGSACGFIIGKQTTDSPSATAEADDYSGPAATTQHITYDSENESGIGSSSGNFDDNNVDYLPPAEAYLASISCIDDPTWRVIHHDKEQSELQGGATAHNHDSAQGCSWVATDTLSYCQRYGVSNLMAFNRAAGGGGPRLIVEAATACQLTCGSCNDSHSVEVPHEDLESTPEKIEKTFEPTSQPQTATPTSLSPTFNPTNSPSRMPFSMAPTAMPGRNPTTKSPTTMPTRTPTRTPASPAPTRATLPPSPFPTNQPTSIANAQIPNQCTSTARRNAYSDKILPYQTAVEVGNVDGTKVGEASGLVASTKHPGILWTHNDRRPNVKGRNKIYALDATSGDIVADFILEGGRNVDWEDMSYHNGFIFVGDVGDNYHTRKSIAIYRVPEPEVLVGANRNRKRISDWDRLNLKFPGGEALNVEAFVLDPISERFYLLTKQGNRIYTTPRVWGLGNDDMTLQRAGFIREVPGDAIVGADISPDGTEILVKYYDEIRYYCRDANVSLEETLSRHYAVALDYDPEPKGESIVWSKDGLYTLSEAKMAATVPLYFYPRNEHK